MIRMSRTQHSRRHTTPITTLRRISIVSQSNHELIKDSSRVVHFPIDVWWRCREGKSWLRGDDDVKRLSSRRRRGEEWDDVQEFEEGSYVVLGNQLKFRDYWMGFGAGGMRLTWPAVTEDKRYSVGCFRAMVDEMNVESFNIGLEMLESNPNQPESASPPHPSPRNPLTY